MMHIKRMLWTKLRSVNPRIAFQVERGCFIMGVMDDLVVCVEGSLADDSRQGVWWKHVGFASFCVPRDFIGRPICLVFIFTSLGVGLLDENLVRRYAIVKKFSGRVLILGVGIDFNERQWFGGLLRISDDSNE